MIPCRLDRYGRALKMPEIKIGENQQHQDNDDGCHPHLSFNQVRGQVCFVKEKPAGCGFDEYLPANEPFEKGAAPDVEFRSGFRSPGTGGTRIFKTVDQFPGPDHDQDGHHGREIGNSCHKC